jgi:lysophospholipase L1-like esterase
VLFFGDSFVAGAGDPRGCGWVGRVAAACAPMTPYNLGVRGETSVQVAARWEAEAWPRLRTEAACGVVFSVGANDAIGEREGDPPRLTAEQSCSAVAGLLDAAAMMELPAFVAGPPPVGEPAADAHLLELTQAFGELCARRQIPYVPVAARLLASGTWVAEAAAGDGAHPAAGGYDELAAILLDGGLRGWIGRL